MMTCVVSLIDDKSINMACDTYYSTLDTGNTRKQGKIFKKKGMLFGISGSVRISDVIRYKFSPPPIKGAQNEYMRTLFVDKLIACLEENKLCEDVNGVISMDSVILLAHKNNIYKIHSDFQVEESSDPFNSCGTGEIAALTAINTIIHEKTSSRDKLKKVLKSVTKYDNYVREPFEFFSIKRT